MMMMSEGEKTEKPTAYKVSKARQDGQVAKSVDLNAAGLLGMALLLIGMSGSYFMQIMMSFMKKSFELDEDLHQILLALDVQGDDPGHVLDWSRPRFRRSGLNLI